MLTRAIALTVGIVFSAVPGVAQTEHQHEHDQVQDSPDMPNMEMHEMMMDCPFFQGMGMHSERMGMMNGGMMEMGAHGAMDHEMMNGMAPQDPSMMGGSMMGMELPSPHHLIGMKDVLNLSEAQITNLETLAGRTSTAVENHMERAMADRVRAIELLSRNVGGFDEYGEALRSAASHMAEAHIAMARSGFEAQSLLTPEQKETAVGGPHGMKGAGMPGGGMMGGSGEHHSGHIHGPI
jgi:hypothetical protein